MRPPFFCSVLTLIVIIYIAVCFGIIAKKHGKNPTNEVQITGIGPGKINFGIARANIVVRSTTSHETATVTAR